MAPHLCCFRYDTSGAALSLVHARQTHTPDRPLARVTVHGRPPAIPRGRPPPSGRRGGGPPAAPRAAPLAVGALRGAPPRPCPPSPPPPRPPAPRRCGDAPAHRARGAGAAHRARPDAPRAQTRGGVAPPRHGRRPRRRRRSRRRHKQRRRRQARGAPRLCCARATVRPRACATPASLVGVPPPAAALLATATTTPPRPLPLPPPPPPLLLWPPPAGAGMAAVDALGGRQAAGRWEKVRRTHPPRQWPVAPTG
ncbi:hypothetical protein BU14_0060s0017 [Porphyra umbilicalis]|uniref:Uncharacterized protein n=1 Tax=Porphyra umbilicalis TaxID=2786 RepID=A0A1X6PGR1_PORUM|nr:hypothetical protein BU14_0060s0017 [Porphyra umbilicalis]|eukprot:OSX80051.1 hypothetical protein BU14_0060s0017 [Porphyra umbilicalis]